MITDVVFCILPGGARGVLHVLFPRPEKGLQM